MEFFLVRIFPHSAWIRRDTLYLCTSPYSVRIRENTDQKKTPYLGTFHVVPIMLNIHKIFKHTLRILQHLLQNFWRVFGRLVDTKHYGVRIFLRFGACCLHSIILTLPNLPALYMCKRSTEDLLIPKNLLYQTWLVSLFLTKGWYSIRVQICQLSTRKHYNKIYHQFNNLKKM